MTMPFVGEVRMFGFNLSPRGWAFCQGQLLPINQNQALFTLLSTNFGGNGTTTFALPDIRGRAVRGTGNNAGSVPLGQNAGAENINLLIQNFPPHNHFVKVNVTEGNAQAPTAGYLTRPKGNLDGQYSVYLPQGEWAASATLNANTIEPTGTAASRTAMQPYAATNFCIALQGVYPTRS